MPSKSLTQPTVSVPALTRVADTLRRHSVGLAVALLLAAALIGPRWWLLATEPAEGSRVQLAPSGAGPFAYDQALYMPNIRDGFDGRLPITQPYGGGDRDTPSQTGEVWLQLIGSLGHLTGGIFSAFALVTTLMALASFLAFYAFCIDVARSRWGAIAFMLGALFFTYLMTVTGGLIALHRWSILEPIATIDPELTFHPWMRFIAPIMPLPAFFAAIITIPKAVDTGRRVWIAAAAISAALLIYSYLFYWVALAAALACWTLWLLYRRDLRAVRVLAIVGVLAVILALPEIIGLAHTGLSTNADFRTRLGTGVSSPFDRPDKSILAQRFLIGLPFMLALLRGPERNRLFIALYVVPLGLSRVAIFLPQPAHFMDFVWPTFALPVFIAGGAEMFALISEEGQRPVLVVLSVIAIGCAGWFAVFQLRAVREVEPAFAMRDDEYAAFRWMDRNIQRGETVASPSIATNLYLAALTPASRYMLEAFVADPRDAEIIDRYLRVSAAFGLSEEITFNRLDPYDTCRAGQTVGCEDDHPNFPFRTVLPFADREADLENSIAYFLLNWEIVQPQRIVDRIPRWRDEFAVIRREQDVLARYDAAYLYCGPRERLWPSVAPAPGTRVTIAFRQGDVTIYRVAGGDNPAATPFRGCDTAAMAAMTAMTPG